VCIRVHSPEMKYTKRSTIGCIFQCSFTGNEIYKTKYHRLHFSVFIHRKWNIQNEVPSVAFFSVHSPEMKCTKPSYRCLHLRRNTLEKNTIYSYTRTLIGQKNFPNLLNGQNLFFWLTLWKENSCSCTKHCVAISFTIYLNHIEVERNLNL
jgi:hypothetical protein